MFTEGPLRVSWGAFLFPVGAVLRGFAKLDIDVRTR